MSTTDTVATATTCTGAYLGPYATHASARRRPAGPGLPGDGGLFDFARLCDEGLRIAADPTGGRFPRLVIGGLPGPAGPEPEPVPLDGATGEVPTPYFFHDRPDLMDRRPLAPSLPTLVRFAAATDELAGLRRQFAARAGRCDTRAVAVATRRLLAVFEEGAGGGPAPLRRMAALIRPLALAAGPDTASGLALDLPVRLLDREFGRGGVVRFEEVDFPATLTHEPTRRFLRGTGLPEDVFFFRLDTDPPLRTLTEHYADGEGAFPPGRLPAHADRLVRLGHLTEGDGLVVDGATGAVLHWSEPDAVLRPLNTDVSTLAFTLWLLHREHDLDEASGHALTGAAYDRLVMTMIQALSSIDPAGTTADPRGHCRA
ncbi:SUKH-4 family immunity protein [Streptomyces viridosporus]|uniref:SUKH-4 family immunity protein n=1 Tax=Streptomyces viridosporus TaxID=67581 RepID=UPI0009BC9BE2|nr:SUKH-4 family immunity protein [Streptomyces viridosporus]